MGVRKWARLVVAGVIVATAGCATKPVQVAEPAAVSLYGGVIVAIRPVLVPTGQAVTLINAAGGVGPGDTQSFSRGQAMEFIVLEDGATKPISVVQGNELQFLPGDRVVITHDGRTRLRRTGG